MAGQHIVRGGALARHAFQSLNQGSKRAKTKPMPLCGIGYETVRQPQAAEQFNAGLLLPKKELPHCPAYWAQMTNKLQLNHRTWSLKEKTP